MNKFKSSGNLLGRSFIYLSIYLCILVTISSCNNKIIEPKYKIINAWIDWNVRFDNSTKEDERAKSLDSVKQYVEVYVKNYNDTAKHKVILVSPEKQTCICDPNLVNIIWKLKIDTSSGSTTVPPQDPTKPKVKGGILEKNEKLSNPFERSLASLSFKPMELKESPGKPEDPIVAIMDTGVDSTLFTPSINNLFWKSANTTTLYNFIYPGRQDDFKDDEPNRHGSHVTGLLLKQSYIRYPRLMILKAFDSTGTGTMFSVTCALSYAIQNRAAVLNGSFGYEGKEDSILNEYVEKADRDQMAMVFAAGNADGTRQDLCASPENPANHLTASKLFYPACFSVNFQNVIAVTGLNSSLSACYYQNYSNEYITIGVKNSVSCCSYRSPFGEVVIEGSSFSTPVVAGKIGANLMRMPGRRPASIHISELVGANTPANTAAEISTVSNFIRNGNFIVQNE